MKKMNFVKNLVYMYNYAAAWQINFMSKMCAFQDQNLKFAKIFSYSRSAHILQIMYHPHTSIIINR